MFKGPQILKGVVVPSVDLTYVKTVPLVSNSGVLMNANVLILYRKPEDTVKQISILTVNSKSYE